MVFDLLGFNQVDPGLLLTSVVDEFQSVLQRHLVYKLR